ncbi:MAG: DoxX family protein [Terriglobales bacterium]
MFYKFRWPIQCGSRWTLLPLRLLIGIGFMAHGLAKWTRGPAKFGLLLQQAGVPFPSHTAWLVTLVEVFGGAALVVGALVTFVSIPLVISMIGAILTVQGHYGFSSVNTIGLTPTGPVFGPPGYEINLLYIAGLLALALSEPTVLSLDHLFMSKTSRREEAYSAVRHSEGV